MLNKEVLRGQRDFDRVYRRGKSTGDRYVVVFYKKNNLPYNRTGFLASKKVGNAVARNRARRLMKESVRNMKPITAVGYDIIFIARNTINNKKCADVKKSIEAAIRRTDLNRR
jgi:ribonuclease P protein component, eubacterial